MKQTVPIQPLLVLLFAVFCCANVAAQSIKVSGKITDNTGTPIIGVTIVIKDTNIGTLSDVDGYYDIQAEPGDILVFSFTGFNRKEVEIKKDSINVELQEAANICYESISIGCFVQILPQINGSWTKLNSEDFHQGNIYHPYQLIQGKVPGLTISKPSGDPLGNFDVQQRGLHTVMGAPEPLVVVDGLPGASLQSIDVQDVESVTVLRDASLASFYGARGANGVVLIESKKSNYLQAFKMRYSGFASVEQVAATPDVLTAGEYRSVINNANSPFYNPAADFGTSTDWADAITRTGFSHAHNLSFSDGFNNTSYRLSLNYRDVNGVVQESGFDQANALLHVSQYLLNDKIRLQGNAAITRRNFTNIDRDLFYYTAVYNPTAPIRTDTSSFGGFFQQPLFDYINPVSLMEQLDNRGEHTIGTANLMANWLITSGLNAKIHYGWQSQSYQRRFRRATDVYLIGGNFERSFDYNVKADFINQSITPSLNYDIHKNEHHVNFTGGYQYQEWTTDAQNATPADLLHFGYKLLAPSRSNLPDSLATRFKAITKLAAFFSQVQYDYRNWLFASAHWRREGSTRFGDNHKWGNFYGFGAGIDFARLANMNFADQLKMRLSYGVAGNLPVDGVYADLILGYAGPYLNNGQFINTIIPARNENQNLQWEERREWNIGLDINLLQHRLWASFDFYSGQTEDMIYTYFTNVPPNLAPFTDANFINFEHRGVEISLNARVVATTDFSWNVTANYATDRSKLVAATTPEGKNLTPFVPSTYLGVPGICCSRMLELEEGEPLGRFVGLELDRFENGQAIYKDQNNDDQIGLEDEVEIGNALPDFTFGIGNNLRWKNLDFQFFLRGAVGHNVVNMHRRGFGHPGNVTRYNVLQSAIGEPDFPLQFSDYYIENASFVTLQNLTIGYDFPLRQKHLSQLKIYLNAQNLFTLSGYSGLDPEVRLKNQADNLGSMAALANGLDVRVGYYPTRAFTLGVQAEF